MNIIAEIIKNDKELFEKEIKEHLEKGYKIITSNISIDSRKRYVRIGGRQYEHNDEPDIYYYALLQKE